MLGIHTVSHLVGTSDVDAGLQGEGVEVAFVLHHVHGDGLIDSIVAVGVLRHDYEVNADGIFKTLLVDYVRHGELLVGNQVGIGQVFAALAADNTDAVPALSHAFLPSSHFLGLLVVVGRDDLEAVSQRAVEAIEVVVELTLHRVLRCNLCDRVLDGAHPAFAVTLAVASVVERNDFLLQHRVDGGSVELVLMALVLIGAAVGQCPTSTFAVAFVPPTIEHGKVDNTIHKCLLARRTGSLEGTGRRVHPDVHTRNEAASQLHVVVVEEDNLADKLGTLADFVNLLDEALACAISGVSLTGEEELHGIVGVVDNLGQTVEVGEEEVRTLVGGKTTGEADEERVGVDLVEQAHDARRIALVLEPVLAEAATDVLNEFRLELHAGVPNHLIGNFVNLFPDLLVALVAHESLVEILVIDSLPLLGAPGGEVYAVGDVAHVAFFGIGVIYVQPFVVGADGVVQTTLGGQIAGPDALEHLLADAAVEPTYTIDFLTSLAEEGGHTEFLALVLGIGAAEAHEVVPRDTKFLSKATHILAEETLFEVVVTCGNGGVHRVERAGTNEFEGFGEVEAALYIVHEALHIAECGVAFVAVVNVLGDAQLLEGEHTTDTEQVFLLQTVFPVATIEGVGDTAVVLRVHFVVRVKQVELDTTHVHLPEGGIDGEVGVGHFHDNLIAVGIEHALNGQTVEILRFVVGNLLAVHRERLGEVTIAIEETNGAHVYVGVGSLLEVVASEHAETARVNLEDVVETVLHAEVGHRRTLVVGLFVHVLAEGGVHFVHLGDEFGVLRHFLQTAVADFVQQLNGVLIYLLPEFLVQAAEEFTALGVPSPPEVVSDLVQFLQCLGDMALDGNRLPRRHVRITNFNVHWFVNI